MVRFRKFFACQFRLAMQRCTLGAGEDGGAGRGGGCSEVRSGSFALLFTREMVDAALSEEVELLVV